MKSWMKILLILPLIYYTIHLMFRHHYDVHENGVILVTGASSGIGKAAAIRMANEGYIVFAGYRKEKDGEMLSKISKNLKPIQLDVTNDDDIKTSFNIIANYVKKTNLPFYGLVNNAGIVYSVPFEMVDIEKAKYLMDVNYFSVVKITQQYLPLLKQTKGSRIILMSSISGTLSFNYCGTYCDGKHALESLGDTLRNEMQEYDISVSLIKPGAILTNVWGDAGRWDKDWPEKNEDNKEFYDNYDREAFASWGNEVWKYADDVSIVSDVVYHSLTSKYPETRYVCGPMIFIPAKLLLPLFYILPDRLTDVVMNLGSYIMMFQMLG